MILHREKRTGDYYTTDRKYQIERGTVGWNVNRLHQYRWGTTYEYSFSCDTLKEVRESLSWIYAQS